MDLTIIFFDGHCLLCSRIVALLLSIDKDKKLTFSPLQGKTAKAKLPQELLADLNTMAYLKNSKLYTKSDAVLEISKTIGGIFAVFYIFKLIPRFIRDAIYDFISKNRIQWFGRSESCRMPSEEEQARFHD